MLRRWVMRLTIELPADVADRLVEHAARRGVTPEQWVAETVLKRFPLPPPPGESLAEFLDGYVGVASGNGEPNAQDTGQKFADHLAEKKRQGNL
jgi:hypothetical protein